MTKMLSHGQHGILSASILVIVTTLFYLVLIQPALSKKTEHQERIEDLSFQLSKFTHAEAQIAQLTDDIQSLKNHDSNNDDFFEGNGPAIIAADLQKKLKALVEASGGNLVSTHAITGKEDDVYPMITIKVHMQVDMNALRAVLFSLNNHKPLLFTDNLLIQRRHVSSRRQNSNSGLIEVRFDVTGYLDLVSA